MPAHQEPHRVSTLAALGELRGVAVGDHILVEESGERFVCVGSPAPPVADRFHWGDGHAWMALPELERIAARKQNIYDIPRATAALLRYPDAVHRNQHEQETFYFIVRRQILLERGLIVTTKPELFVDGVLQYRQVQNGAYLRFYHLSQVRRNNGGTQIWP